MSVSDAYQEGLADAAESGQLVDGQGGQVGPHECENGDGNRVRFVLLDLDESAVQSMCAACTMAMFVAVAQQMAEQAMAADSDNAAAGV